MSCIIRAVVTELVAELVLDAHATLGEGPVWDFRRGRLLFTDIPENVAYSFNPMTGEKAVISRGVNVSGIALNRDGSLVFGGAAGLHVCRADGTCRKLVAEHEGDGLVVNDILAVKLDTDGDGIADETVSVFDSQFADYFWSIQNNGLRLMQVVFVAK